MISLIPMECNFIAGRLETFGNWEFEEPEICTSNKMAEHGFYLCGGKKEPDLARCFVCLKELEGWEADDDPANPKYHHTGCPLPPLEKPLGEITVTEFMNLLQIQLSNSMLLRCEREVKGFESNSAKLRKKLETINVRQKRVK